MITKLSRIQAELKAPKSQRNDFGKYNYRSCEDILEAVKPLLASEGLVLTITDNIEMVGNRYYVKATATVTDGEKSISTTAYAREADGRKGMDESQVTGSSSSYARKYALNGLFCIDDTKDADSMKPAEEPKKQPKAKAKPKQEPAPVQQTEPQQQSEEARAALRVIVEEGASHGIQPADFASIIQMKYRKTASSQLTDDEVNDLAANYMGYMAQLVGG